MFIVNDVGVLSLCVFVCVVQAYCWLLTVCLFVSTATRHGAALIDDELLRLPIPVYDGESLSLTEGSNESRTSDI